MSYTYQVEILTPESSFVEKVIELGDSNSKTLGHFPRNAFIDQARKGQIYIVKDGQQLIGYVMWRYVKRNHCVTITHFCISEDYRGSGASFQLLNYLIDQSTGKCRGLRLKCREDYTYAIKFWKKFGFKAIGEVESRGANNFKLIVWFYKLEGFLDLFQDQNEVRKIEVALDANLIIKLRDNELASIDLDWLSSDFDFCFSDEMYNEIIRDKNPQRRISTRSFLSKNLIEKSTDSQKCKQLADELKIIIPGSSENDNSDRMHLASAIIEMVPFFITLDEVILRNSYKIQDRYKIKIFSPDEFILQIDSILGRKHPEIDNLYSNDLSIKKVTGENYKYLLKDFVNVNRGEKVSQKSKELISYEKNSINSRIEVVRYKGEPCLFWSSYQKENTIIVNMLRSKLKPKEEFLKNLPIKTFISRALKNNCLSIKIKDRNLDLDWVVYLNEYGFISLDNTWVKTVIPQVIRKEEFLDVLPQRVSERVIKDFSQAASSINKLSVVDLEKKFFPVKFESEGIPCFIIPIQAKWAEQLFDSRLASWNLFGSDARLMWRNENIYYRSVRPNIEKVPARILWYISGASSTIRTQCIAAASYLDNVYIDTSKELLRSFNEYGVFKWEQLNNLAKRDTNKQIKAIEFSFLEVFSSFISLADYKDISLKGSAPQTITKVSEKEFFRFYQLGKGYVQS